MGRAILRDTLWALASPKWLVFVALALAGCGVDERLDNPNQGDVGFDAQASAELHAVGLDKYFGRFQPSNKETIPDKWDVYSFTPDDGGPVCIHGAPYKIAVQDRGSQDLQIYLQGGGACWSEICETNQQAAAGIPPVGWTSDDPDVNGALYRFNVVFVAYCDGSVHSGDNVAPDPNSTDPRRHRGVANFSAALDVAKSRFPNPRRIVLSGSSAGGFGTILGAALTQLAYPHTPLYVIDDAGPGVLNPDEPSLLDAVKHEWNVAQFIPASCDGCIESGQFTTLVSWELDHDPSLEVSVFSAFQDSIIGGVFMKMKGPDYEQLLRDETGKVYAAHPNRYHRFFWTGGAHTAILGGYSDIVIQGTSLVQFTQGMLDGTPVWRDLLQ